MKKTPPENAGQRRSSERSVIRSVPAVRRAAAILWLLAKQHSSLGLSEIARRVDILPSTALHILREMAASHLIAFDPTAKTYRLGRGIVDLAEAVIGQDGFAEASRPYLQAISKRFGVTAIATSTVDELHTACVVSITPPGELSLTVTLGGRVPTLSGAAGRCIAAFSNNTQAQLRRNFERIRWQAPLEFRTWLDQVNAVPVKGYAEDDSLFALGITTLAAPVFTPNGIVSCAIGIVTISAATTAAKKTAMAAALVDAASKISLQLRQ